MIKYKFLNYEFMKRKNWLIVCSFYLTCWHLPVRATPPVACPELARSVGLAGPRSGMAFRATHSPHQPWPPPSEKGSFVESPLRLSHLSHTVSDHMGMGDCDLNLLQLCGQVFESALFVNLWFFSDVLVEKETSEAEEELLGGCKSFYCIFQFKSIKCECKSFYFSFSLKVLKINVKMCI